jgi:hypothetical protein
MSEYFFFKIYQNSIFCELYFMCLVHTGFIIGLCRGRDRMVVGLYKDTQCLSPLKLRVRILLRQGVLDTTLYNYGPRNCFIIPSKQLKYTL